MSVTGGIAFLLHKNVLRVGPTDVQWDNQAFSLLICFIRYFRKPDVILTLTLTEVIISWIYRFLLKTVNENIKWTIRIGCDQEQRKVAKQRHYTSVADEREWHSSALSRPTYLPSCHPMNVWPLILLLLLTNFSNRGSKVDSNREVDRLNFLLLLKPRMKRKSVSHSFPSSMRGVQRYKFAQWHWSSSILFCLIMP